MSGNKVIKNTAKLLSAGIIAQAIGILIYPILTRLYSPEDFGLLNLFQSIGGVLTLVATGEYQFAILLPKEERKAEDCLFIGLTILVAGTFVCCLSIPFAHDIADIFNSPELADWYWMLPLFVFVSGAWSMLNYWHTRHQNYTLASTYQVSKSLLNAGLKTIAGLIGFFKGGLIVATVISALLALGLNAARSAKQYKWNLSFFRKAEKRTAIEYKKFPLFSLPTSLTNYLSSNLPFLLLTPVFGLKEIGFFGMALTLSFMPVNIVYNSIYQVLFQEISEKVNQKQSIIRPFRQFVGKTLIIVPPLFILLYFFLPFLTEFILGEGWESTGVYIQYMLPWLLTCLIAGSTCFVTDIFMKQEGLLIFEVVSLIAKAISLAIGIYTNDMRIVVIGLCAVSFITNTAQIFWFRSLVKRYERSIGTGNKDIHEMTVLPNDPHKQL